MNATSPFTLFPCCSGKEKKETVCPHFAAAREIHFGAACLSTMCIGREREGPPPAPSLLVAGAARRGLSERWQMTSEPPSILHDS